MKRGLGGYDKRLSNITIKAWKLISANDFIDDTKIPSYL